MIDRLQAEFGIPDCAHITSGNNGLPKLVLSHRSGSAVEVYLHGAHVTSWKNSKGEELFFISRSSHFEPSKPIRGGIPICWPQFGGQGPLPQHGFARTRSWRLLRTEKLGDDALVAEFELSENADSLAMWPNRFTLRYQVLLDTHTLTIGLRVMNTDDDSFDFQLALHTYFQVADITRVAITGLTGTTYVDTLRENVRETEERNSIRFDSETDRIYVGAPDAVVLADEARGRVIRVEKKNLTDWVVWNPWIAKAQRMQDFGDEEYQRMVCIESGAIASPVTLAPHESWECATTFASET